MCCYYCFSYGLFEVGRTVLLSKRIHVISITVESARRILRVELTGYLDYLSIKFNQNLKVQMKIVRAAVLLTHCNTVSFLIQHYPLCRDGPQC